jgi:hypothetical protein
MATVPQFHAGVDGVKVGDTVTSRWSESGAKWIITALVPSGRGLPAAEMTSTTSTRTDTRELVNLRIATTR